MDDLARAWDQRIDGLLGKLPLKLRRAIGWLRSPSRRVLRTAAALLLVLGGIFSILPILGLWMLPLGLALLAEDVPALKRPLERAARWCERVLARIGRKRAAVGDPSARLDGEKSNRASA